LNHNDVTYGYFPTSFISTGLENEEDPNANTHSIVGSFNYSGYEDNFGYYRFKLIYRYNDANTPNHTIIWKQKSWITDNYILNADLTGVPDQSYQGDGSLFRGLGKSSQTSWIYLDGDGYSNGEYWNSVGTRNGWYSGIRGYNAKLAYSQSLYILDPS